MNSPIVNPDRAQARERYEKAQAALRLALEEGHRLSNLERPRLSAAYAALFGDLERMLQQETLESAELGRRVELLSIKIARGETLTPEIIDLINQVVDKEFARFRRRIDEAFTMSNEERSRRAAERDRADADEELVKLYRTLVKQMHPDAVGGTEREGEQWHQMQRAYRTGDVHQLRALLDVLGVANSANDQRDSWPNEQFVAEAERLEMRTAIEHRKLARMRSHEPFTFEHELESEQWCARRRKELMAAIEQRRTELQRNRDLYTELTGGAALPGTNPSKSADVQTFDEDFMKNTYFGQR